MSITILTIADLRPSPLNVRTNAEDNAATAALESSILAFGLLKPLIVHPFRKGAAKDLVGLFGVLAGGRRYRAIRNLVDRGDLPADWPIDTVHRDLSERELVEISLAENLFTKELRPYEVYAGVARAVAKGTPVEQIAEHYGQTPHAIRQLVRLGNLAPVIFAALEAGELTIKQARAYAATEDHALQMRAWDALHAEGWKHSPERIHAAMDIGEREAARLLAFVGAAAYRDAGGRYELDLFADDDEQRGRVVDRGLLQQLADAKLEETRTRLRKRTGRDLRFAAPPTSSYGGIDYQLQVECKLAPPDGFDAARVAELDRIIADCDEMGDEHYDDDGEALPGSEEAIAAIAAIRAPAEAERHEIQLGRRMILPEGELIAAIDLGHDGEAQVTFWWPDRKAKAAHDKAVQSGQSLKPIGKAAPAPAAPRVIDGDAVRGPSTAAAAIARDEHGVSADSIEVIRSLRRELLRALLVKDAEQPAFASRGTTGATNNASIGTDYAIWSTLRNAIGDGRPERTGARGTASGGEIGGFDLAKKAREHVEATEAHRVWQAAIAELGRRSFITEPDHAAAFLDYTGESAATKRLAGAVVAGLALERSANAPGFRIAAHDALAGQLRAHPAMLRRLWTPTAEFLGLVPRVHRLAIAEPLVDKSTHERWSRAKAADLTNLLARALGTAGNGVRQGAKTAARDWVHPLLAFRGLKEVDRGNPADDETGDRQPAGAATDLAELGRTPLLEAAE